MKEGRPSHTALAGAAVRALETLLPVQLRWCTDELAAAFLEPHHRLLLACCRASGAVRNLVERSLDQRYSGVPMDFISRTRWIDERVVAWLANAPERLIVAGAGYDTRCLRLTMPANVERIEVDHPSTQARKHRIATARFPQRAASVRWLPQDLTLGAPGLPLDQQRTLTVVEGLSGYLPLASVEALLAWVHNASSVGSALVFTYIEATWLREEIRSDGPIVRALRRNGESFLTSFTRTEVSTLLSAHGFAVAEDVSEQHLAEDMMRATVRTLACIPGFRLAFAHMHSATGTHA